MKPNVREHNSCVVEASSTNSSKDVSPHSPYSKDKHLNHTEAKNSPPHHTKFITCAYIDSFCQKIIFWPKVWLLKLMSTYTMRTSAFVTSWTPIYKQAYEIKYIRKSMESPTVILFLQQFSAHLAPFWPYMYREECLQGVWNCKTTNNFK